MGVNCYPKLYPKIPGENFKLGWVLKNKNPTAFFTHPTIVRLSAHDEVPSQEGTFQISLLRGARGVLFIAQRKKIEIPIH